MVEAMVQTGKRDSAREIKKGSVHILLCGHSTGHIATVVEKMKPVHVELLTSEELYQETRALMQELDVNSKSITSIPAFTNAALKEGIRAILARYWSLRGKFPDRETYIGITGGTNVMVVEAAVSALAVGASMHYLLKDTCSETRGNGILLFDSREIRSFLAQESQKERSK